MSRATMFGERSLTVQGGYYQPVYFVLNSYVAEDQDRGVRGVSDPDVQELLPRPSVKQVTVEQITRYPSVLQAGDLVVQVAANQITITDLQDRDAAIQIGYDLFSISHFDTTYIAGREAYYNLYVRGTVSGNS